MADNKRHNLLSTLSKPQRKSWGASNGLIITMGDPAGIGPCLVVDSISNLGMKKGKVLVIGCKKILSRVKGFKKILPKVTLYDLDNCSGVTKGCPDKNSGLASKGYLEEAVRILKGRNNYSLVTAPVSKEAVKKTDRNFIGHTEFLSDRFQVKKFAMMMVGKRLKIVFITRHIPICDVSKSSSYGEIKKVLELTAVSLRNLFKIKKPKIALCSLNPHAGIDTYLGKEEKVLIKAKNTIKQNADFVGPYPSDTLFKEALQGKFSAVIAFYHDQGMIPFKSLEFSQGVNLTLGLPFIRTSPAHGPAFNLAFRPDKIDYRSMREAVKLALMLPCYS